jgi:hypothetical protein
MTESTGQNQYPYHRHFIRHKVRLKVHVRSDTSFQTWTHNLSEGGACFEIPERVAVGEEVLVWIYTEKVKGEPPIEARARIVWCDQGKKGTRHGAQFVSYKDDGLLRLRSHLAAL